MVEGQAEREDLRCTFEVVDLTTDQPTGLCDGAYSLDVIEHVEPEREQMFMATSTTCSNRKRSVSWVHPT